MRLPRDGEIFPWRPLEASMISVTTLLVQVIPSHWQQSVPLIHELLRPPLPSNESPSRKSMRELLSCSVQELTKEAVESRRTKARPKEGTGSFEELLLQHGKFSGRMILS